MTKQHLFYPCTVTPTRHANQRGGVGELVKAGLLDFPVNGSIFSAMSVLTIPPGSSIGVHLHPDDEEAYIVISGTATYTSEEGEHPMGPGDIALCYQGEKHGIANTGETDLVMAGIVVKR
jgi:Mannose-6-phosphate isomerase